MKNVCLYLMLIGFLPALVSCKEKKPKVKDTNAGIPKALQDESDANFSSYKRGADDLVEALYQEALEKREDLQEVERIVKEVMSLKKDSTKDFVSFRDKNEQFYKLAMVHATEFSDTVLQDQVQRMLIKSRDSLSMQINSLLVKDSLVSQATNEVLDAYYLLKMQVALQIMERYQDDYAPPEASLQQAFDHLQQAKKKLDSISAENFSVSAQSLQVKDSIP